MTVPPNPQRVEIDRLMAFLDELTNLSRKYNLIVFSNTGSFQVGHIPFSYVQQGRYFSDVEQPEEGGPITDDIDCYFDSADDLSTVIDLTKL